MIRIGDSTQGTAVLVRSTDWSCSPLGPSETWPEALKLLVSVMLGSHQPMFVVWGPELRMIYNDGYAEILADKHPDAMGAPFYEVWSEIRSDLEPIVGKALSGEAVFMDDIELLMRRKGYVEETHFSFSYTPVRNAANEVVGIFCPCVETTVLVSSQRRLVERERDLSEALAAREDLLSQKDALLAEVNHRVKNSLQLVVSTLGLQGRRLTDPATKAVFAQAIARVRAITSVHERLYKSDDPLVVDMAGYLEGLVDDLAGTPGTRSRMKLEVDRISLRTERAIPLAIVVNELITNSLEYAYPVDRPGPILISLRKNGDGMLELAVADEGVGMANKESVSDGLGARLVSTMANQLGGEVVRRASEDGYRVVMSFPEVEV